MSERAGKHHDPAGLKEISDSAAELVDRMRQIVWTLNEEEGSVEDLGYYITAYARDFLRRHGIELKAGIPPADKRMLSSKQRRNIFLVVKEALNNVVKHSGATDVLLSMEVPSGHLNIAIHDNGKGLVTESRPGHYGMQNMKVRMDDIGGTFSCTGDSGVRIELTIPVA
ncbi:MAG: hypothetical protein JNM00_09755, partial [Flavobacteriales bacterium]|nr:hypothetical protein [Flavobacteriales bacterium]